MAQGYFVIPSSMASELKDDFESETLADAEPESTAHLHWKDASSTQMRQLMVQLQPVSAKRPDTPPTARSASPSTPSILEIGNPTAARTATTRTPSIFEIVNVTYRELRVPELLCLCFCGICCPRRTASTLAFWPPCPPTYQFYEDDDDGDSAKLRIILEDTAFCPYTVEYLEFAHRLEVFTATSTVPGSSIACVHLSCAANPKYTILRSHSNAVDVGQDIDFGLVIGIECQCNVVVYDYSGYGQSTGRYSERNVYADAAAVFQELLSRYRLEASDVVLSGHSIGTVPTVDLAMKFDVAGVILCCPLASALRTIFPCVSSTWFFDSFPNIEKVSKISSPVLVIHGTDDKVIRIKDAVDIYRSCPTCVTPLWIDGAGHNDIQYHILFHQRIRQFIDVDLHKTKA